jgi:DNA-binding NtrC family response regulator
LGGDENISINVRFLFATKVDLYNHVKSNRFREDLYYRLNIIPVKLPPLRERKEDIIPLLTHFFQRRGVQEKIKFLTPEIQLRLIQYDWPGNVRELENVAEKIIIMSEAGTLDNLILGDSRQLTEKENTLLNNQRQFPPYEEYMNQKEKEILKWALKVTNNNITSAANLLKLPRSTLRSKLKIMSKSSTF